MPAYLVVEVNDVSDGDAIMQYVERVVPIADKHGGRYLARGPVTVLEGEHQAQMLVIIEFPTNEQLHAFYHSEDYAPLIELRQGASSCTFLTVDGL